MVGEKGDVGHAGTPDKDKFDPSGGEGVVGSVEIRVLGEGVCDGGGKLINDFSVDLSVAGVDEFGSLGFWLLPFGGGDPFVGMSDRSSWPAVAAAEQDALAFCCCGADGGGSGLGVEGPDCGGPSGEEGDG